jgi:hypothetical protein
MLTFKGSAIILEKKVRNGSSTTTKKKRLTDLSDDSGTETGMSEIQQHK